MAFGIQIGDSMWMTVMSESDAELRLHVAAVVRQSVRHSYVTVRAYHWCGRDWIGVCEVTLSRCCLVLLDAAGIAHQKMERDLSLNDVHWDHFMVDLIRPPGYEPSCN